MDFVTFEIAKKLKEKGFNEKCFATYDNDGMLGYVYYQPQSIHTVSFDDCLYYGDNVIAAPTISQVLKWLREVHNVYVDIGLYVITKDMLKYNINVYHNKNRKDLMYSGIHLTKECSKYEEACEIALKYVLDNLI